MYSLKINKKALKFLQSRSASERKIIKQKFNFLSENPYSQELLDVKKTKESTIVYELGKLELFIRL